MVMGGFSSHNENDVTALLLWYSYSLLYHWDKSSQCNFITNKPIAEYNNILVKQTDWKLQVLSCTLKSSSLNQEK